MYFRYDVPPDEESEEEKAERKLWAMRLDHHLKHHPDRTCPYELIAHTAKEIAAEPLRNNRDYLFIEWVRQASNISNLFRSELGGEFWSNINLVVRDIKGLPAFLKERLAIHKSIKSLHLELDFEDGHSPWESAAKFKAWLAYVTKALKLDHLDIWCGVGEKEVAQFGSGKGRFSFLSCPSSGRSAL